MHSNSIVDNETTTLAMVYNTACKFVFKMIEQNNNISISSNGCSIHKRLHLSIILC